MTETIILNGNELSKKLLHKMKLKVEIFQNITGKVPSLIIFMAGNNPASEIYVKKKIKACEEIGIKCSLEKIENIDGFFNPEEYMAYLIEKANKSENIDAIIIQLNLPEKINQKRLLSLINPEKDIDALTEENLGLLVQGNPRFESCTPLGIIKLLEEYNILINGAFVVIINSSNIVGKPLFTMLLKIGATVAMCHDKTPKELLNNLTKQADIIVSATGIENFITKEMVNEKATIIDVGIVKKGNKIIGDVDYKNLNGFVKAITPVPGGVGPMTVAMLLQNTIDAAYKNKGIDLIYDD